jgi:hypothetical protein
LHQTNRKSLCLFLRLPKPPIQVSQKKNHPFMFYSLGWLNNMWFWFIWFQHTVSSRCLYGIKFTQSKISFGKRRERTGRLSIG